MSTGSASKRGTKYMLPKFLRNPDPDVYLGDSYVVLDFETTNLSTGHARDPDNRLVCGWLYDSRDRSWHFISSGLELSNHFDRLLEVDFIVAHHAKFELQWLAREGFPIEQVLTYCTLLGDYVRSGNRKGFCGRMWGLALSICCKRYGVEGKDALVSGLIRSGVCPSDIQWSVLRRYCRRDVYATLQVFLRQRRVLAKRGLLPVAFVRNIFTVVAADLEMRGMHLDSDVVRGFSKQFRAQYQKVISSLDSITGGINMGSPQQVAKFIYETLAFRVPDVRGRPALGKRNKAFPDGQPKTDDPTISLLRPKTAEQRKFLKLKSEESTLRKKISGYLNLYDKAVAEAGGMVYGSINQTRTKTHRLSSSGPNLQNQDRLLKPVFNARTVGWRICNADYPQLEYRIAILLAKDEQGYEDIAGGHDPHAHAASIMYGDKFDSLDKDDPVRAELRNKAKADTFKPLYGGSTGSTKQVKYYDDFKSRYWQIANMQDRWIQECLDTKRLTCMTGLITYWPGTRYTESGFIENSTKIANYQVQMFATADLATIGATFLWHALRRGSTQSFMVNEVHDSVLIETHPDEEDEVAYLCKRYMGNVEVGPFIKKVYGIEIDVPINPDISIKSNWDWDRRTGKALFKTAARGTVNG